MIADSTFLVAMIVALLLLSLMERADVLGSLDRLTPPASDGPDGAPAVGLGIIVTTPSSEAVACHAFDSPAVRRIEFVPALSAAPVQLLARADRNRTRDGRARLCAAFAAALGFDNPPPMGSLSDDGHDESANCCCPSHLRTSPRIACCRALTARQPWMTARAGVFSAAPCFS